MSHRVMYEHKLTPPELLSSFTLYCHMLSWS